MDEHFLAEAFGYDCYDGTGDSGTSPNAELDRRVGKGDLWDRQTESWSLDDLWDIVEVFHDLTSRPTRGWMHGYSDCGWHPSHFSAYSGQHLYRWRVNKILAASALPYRLAESGADQGRIVRSSEGELDRLIDDTLSDSASNVDEIAHAVEQFRSRTGSRHDRRSAVTGLARLLEDRRSEIKSYLLSKDEASLFQIANKFDIRHMTANQHSDYPDEYLEWIFYWYLATFRLTESIRARQHGQR